MHPRYYLALAVFLLLLGACGRSDASAPASPQTAKQAGGDIADLLRAPPAPGQMVEIDAYHWVGWMNTASYTLDRQGCPQQSTYLSDWAVPSAIRFPSIAYTNSSHGYPPASDPWLIPIPTLTTLTLNATSSVPGSIGTQLPPTYQVVPSSLDLPYYGRLRGHLGDPAVAKCAYADRIFVVEGIAAVYTASEPQDSRSDLLQPPARYDAWPRYHDAALGYSFAYAPDWMVEPLREPDVLSAVAVRTSQAPAAPFVVRVHDGAMYIDPYDDSTISPRIKWRKEGDRSGQFDQDFIHVVDRDDGQHLHGFWVERVLEPNTRMMSVLISAHGRTYELTAQYAVGLNADQSLLDRYMLLLARFRLDTLPEPSPTPPIQQAVGAGPFLSQDEAVEAARRTVNNTLELIDAKLVSEAEMRQFRDCGWFQGHPDGVWLLHARIIADGQGLTVLVGLNAKTGARLCTANEEMGTPLPTWIPDVIPTATLLPGYPAPSPRPPTLTPDLPYPKPAVTSP